MAELDVQPKRPSYWWLWLLLTIIALAIILFLAKGCNSKTATTTSDSTIVDSTATVNTVAATEPDWNAVDFNAAKTTDDEISDKDIAVNSNGRYTIYTLGENILFATDQATLQGNAGDKLKQIVASLNKRFKGSLVGVYGSTDATGTASHNKMLGAERAKAVQTWLTTTGGLDSAKVSIHSLGEAKPVASNETASGRKQNRNVSIVAFPKQ